MDKIKIFVRTPDRMVSDMVRITPEARRVLQDILDSHNVSARQVVSQLIIQGAPMLEFVQGDVQE